MGKIPEKLPFTLNHTVSVGGESAGPHKEKLTSVKIIRAIKAMEGLKPPQVDAFLQNLAKESGAESKAKETKAESKVISVGDQGSGEEEVQVETESESEAEAEEEANFEDIPEYDQLVNHGLDSFEKVALFRDANGLQTIDGIGPKYEDKILAFLDNAGYGVKEEPQDEENDSKE